MNSRTFSDPAKVVNQSCTTAIFMKLPVQRNGLVRKNFGLHAREHVIARGAVAVRREMVRLGEMISQVCVRRHAGFWVAFESFTGQCNAATEHSDYAVFPFGLDPTISDTFEWTVSADDKAKGGGGLYT